MDDHLELVLKELRGVEFTLSSPEQVLSRVAAVGSISTEPSGSVLFQEGESHDRVYIVCDGSVALEMHTTGRGAKRILTVGAGEVLAWSAFLGNGEMTATSVVLEDAKLISFSASELTELCEHDHDLGYVVMRWFATAISRRLLATRLQLIDVFGDGAS